MSPTWERVGGSRWGFVERPHEHVGWSRFTVGLVPFPGSLSATCRLRGSRNLQRVITSLSQPYGVSSASMSPQSQCPVRSGD